MAKKTKLEYSSTNINQISKRANVSLNVILFVACVLAMIPVWLIIISSFTQERSLMVYGYRF